MRFGDGDARMLWTWILKLVVDGLAELRKLECRCKSGLVAGRLRTPRPTRLQPNQIGRVEEPVKIAPALGMRRDNCRVWTFVGWPHCVNHIEVTKQLNQIGFRSTPIEAPALHQTDKRRRLLFERPPRFANKRVGHTA